MVLALVALLGGAAAADEAAYRSLTDQARALLVRSEESTGSGNRTLGALKAREALDVLARADALDAARLEAPFLGVQAAVLAGDVSAAGRWLDAFTRRNVAGDENPDLHYLLACVRLRQEGRPDLALESLDRMAVLDPGARAESRDALLAQALSAEARRRFEAEDFRGMASLYSRAVDLARRRGDEGMEIAALRNLGLALQLSDEFAEAVGVFRALQKREPENPYWAWRAAVNLANHARWAEAVPLYEETVRLVEAGKGSAADLPEMIPVHLRLANCRRILAGREPDAAARADLLQRARKGLARYIELVPRDARGPYWMGVLLYEEMEEPYQAVPFFQRAYALDPVCDASLRNLVQIHARYPPPEGVSKEAWEAQGAAQEKELTENAAARAEARKARFRSPAKDDGCE